MQNQTGGGARTYVFTRGNRVIGYYSLAPSAAMPEDAPDRIAKGQGRYPVPVILMARFALDILMARFALDQSEQGKGLGKALLRDALRRALAGAETIGGRAFTVHARDEDAVSFYAKYGMEPSPNNAFTLFLLFKDIRQTLGVSFDG